MSRWARGEAEIDRLLAEGGLQQVSGAAADGEAWLEKAARVLGTARAIVTGDPESAYVLVYDAARQACVGLLAHQGLRATSKGGHYVVERAVAPSSETGSRGLARCGAGATSWSTRAIRASRPSPERWRLPSRWPNASSRRRGGCCRMWGDSDASRSG
jgi:hypothetical protein